MSYIKFLNLVQAIRTLPDFPVMDTVEEQLLNTFAVAWETGKQMTVLGAMESVDGVSPSTIHRRLKTLRSKGMIALDVDEIDSRIKYIIETPLSRKYFRKLEACLAKAGE